MEKEPPLKVRLCQSETEICGRREMEDFVLRGVERVLESEEWVPNGWARFDSPDYPFPESMCLVSG